MNAAFGMIIHAVHVYDDDAVENGAADECPNTPRVTSVEFDSNMKLWDAHCFTGSTIKVKCTI